MLKSNLYDYSDTHIHVTGTKTTDEAGAERLDKRSKWAIFKNCAQVTDCISKINKTQIDNTKYLDDAMLMYNLTEYSDNYLKTLESIWEYYRDDPNDNIVHYESFKFKIVMVIQRMLTSFITWSANFNISYATRKTKFAITDTECSSGTLINSR